MCSPGVTSGGATGTRSVATGGATGFWGAAPLPPPAPRTSKSTRLRDTAHSLPWGKPGFSQELPAPLINWIEPAVLVRSAGTSALGTAQRYIDGNQAIGPGRDPIRG